LVNRVLKADELLSKTHEFATKLAQAPTRSIGLTKRAFNRGLTVDLDTALENEAMLQEIAGHSADLVEGVKAFVEKRVPQFKGK
jgi:2-(1,2-epoxy-1,2-dihydrophenyl)acetyl-CoA isomerase